jgi:carboxyl-terminal processing protease
MGRPKPCLAVCVLFAVMTIACNAPSEPPEKRAQQLALPAENGDGASPVSRARPSKPSKKNEKKAARLPQAKQMLGELLRLVREKHITPLDEDALYSGALQGVLDRLQPPGASMSRPPNTLLTPAWLAELKVGLKGRFSGLGMVIKKVETMVLIPHVIKGGPAHRANIKAGDRLLAIDGQAVDKLSLAKIVGMIRGKTGSAVELYLQRGTREWRRSVTRGRVTIPAISHKLLRPTLGYLQISNFNEQTVTQLDHAIETLKAKGVHELVIDLRGCPGGQLSTAIEVADRFLPAGKRIVSIKFRNAPQRIETAKAVHPADAMPLVVMVNRKTASGAEILAAALRDHRRAWIVGEPTFGKGTVEEVFKLGNGWGVKLSVGRFFSPSGQSLQGRGVQPDFAIVGPNINTAYQATRASSDELKQDPQVRAAIHLLGLRRSR